MSGIGITRKPQFDPYPVYILWNSKVEFMLQSWSWKELFNYILCQHDGLLNTNLCSHWYFPIAQNKSRMTKWRTKFQSYQGFFELIDYKLYLRIVSRDHLFFLTFIQQICILILTLYQHSYISTKCHVDNREGWLYIKTNTYAIDF